MDNWICQLGNDYIFSNVINYYAAHLQQLIAASLLKKFNFSPITSKAYDLQPYLATKNSAGGQTLLINFTNGRWLSNGCKIQVSLQWNRKVKPLSHQ